MKAIWKMFHKLVRLPDASLLLTTDPSSVYSAIDQSLFADFSGTNEYETPASPQVPEPQVLCAQQTGRNYTHQPLVCRAEEHPRFDDRSQPTETLGVWDFSKDDVAHEKPVRIPGWEDHVLDVVPVTNDEEDEDKDEDHFQIAGQLRREFNRRNALCILSGDEASADRFRDFCRIRSDRSF
ncbi:hypothetical protein NX059_010121 [Plenodomus lindquistii]|nr:hypothetical protein NX059_010121 [Plenodomus lindquistii]